VSSRRKESPSWNSSSDFAKKNIILEVADKSIVMFFKKGLMDSSLIPKLAMKNPRMPEEMIAIANSYALVEEDHQHQRAKGVRPHRLA
jgi:hypothetical protein